jgi:hypothetical protein
LWASINFLILALATLIDFLPVGPRFSRWRTRARSCLKSFRTNHLRGIYNSSKGSPATRYQIPYYGGNVPASLPLLTRIQFVAMKYRTVTLSD